MNVERFTELEIAILSALAEYRFLTAGHLDRLALTKNKRHLYAVLSAMDSRKLINHLDFGAIPTGGRLAHLWYLTPRGATELAEANGSDPATVPSRPKAFPYEYQHRVNCISFHIHVAEWARANGHKLDFFKSYFAPKPVSVGVTPDAVFSLTEGTAQRLFAFEMCNQRRTKRVERKLISYIPTLRDQAIEEATDYPFAMRLLLVFDSNEGEVLVRNRLGSDFAPYERRLYFKTLDEPNFKHGWRTLAGAQSDLF